MNANVLIISNPEDIHTSAVVKQLHELGARYYLFYPERLTGDLMFTLVHRLIGGDPSCHLQDGNTSIDLSHFNAVWYRRPRLVATPEDISAEGLEFARDEWRAALDSAYSLMSNTLWVSHPTHLQEAARKPLQLRIARQVGLCTPKTLITNNADAARDFHKACDGQVIVKPTGSGWVYAQDSEDVFCVMTNRITAEELRSDEQLRTAPVTFQEEVPKLYELRVNIVGQQVLSIKIDSQSSSISALDWRRYDIMNTPYTPYDLPKEVAAKCILLTRRLGLEFGAIDLIRRPDGEYVFLEINGNGQFLWAEQLSGVEVSNALACLLAGISPPLSILTLC
jgi:glutathione synthase/RimK-type ligase-like ATP-grasp enzyme